MPTPVPAASGEMMKSGVPAPMALGRKFAWLSQKQKRLLVKTFDTSVKEFELPSFETEHRELADWGYIVKGRERHVGRAGGPGYIECYVTDLAWAELARQARGGKLLALRSKTVERVT